MADAVGTGVAGFIGSTLAERLIVHGWTVRGVDCFTPYYERRTKEDNLTTIRDDAGFTFIEADLRTADVRPLIDGASAVFHVAAQPGVRLSWSDGFAEYDGHNVLATQRLLEAARVTRAPRLVYASSSSVYGNAPRYPTMEDDLPRPHSPYGVTKLAAEHLCNLYAANWGLSTVSLRYFTVYGPRQRPDMAMHRLCQAVLTGQPFPLFGDGSAVRDFTFVDDVVSATVAAASAEVPPGTVVNISGGSSLSMARLLQVVEDVAGDRVPVDRRPPQPGDVQRTGGAIDQAIELLSWKPTVDIRTGVERQLRWHAERRGRPAAL
jgi:UDP-glucuronate 4-epimerase